ncbi:uncharacterized protein LOC122363353 [Amphibalanus amphitrite]|uniref:uncharacterized protein LOC122363353 n=1 Tax=Amphibalanus amphitrite TaxID=1232801 RepID=UPI001C905BFA|nr:uncharacterized protein LOC122363353 [Amphibalanus amphitrite]XP_043188462.1 uncharacterized protein LOC122363353 [Amphibalanus amphitrite]
MSTSEVKSASTAEAMEVDEPAAGPSGASAAMPDLDRVVLDVSDSEDERDEFGLVETALSQALRPVLRRCDDVLEDPDSVQVSAITSEQRRALGRVDGDGTGPRAEIVTDFVKLEVEEHELEEEPADGDPAWTISETFSTPRAEDHTGYGRPYKTTSVDRRARGRGVRVATTPGVAPSRGRGSPVGRGRAPATPGRGRARGRGRGSRGRGRGRGQIQIQPSPGVVHLQAGRPVNKLNGPIEVLLLPERELRVAVVRDRLVLQWIDENVTETVPSYNVLTFMELVKIKEALTKMVEKCNRDGPDEHVPRLRTARRTAISWVETRLRAEAQGDIVPSTHGKQGKSKYDALPGPPTPVTPSSKVGGSALGDTPRGRGRPLLPKSASVGPPVLRAALTGSRQATLPGQTPAPVDDSDDPDYDPTLSDGSVPMKPRKPQTPRAQTQPANLPTNPFGSARLVNINTQVKNPKSSRDIVILQAKLRDLQNVGAELRRAVDYFSVEAQKDKGKINRLKNEGVVLEKKLKELEASILGNSPSVLISLLDKDKRKALTASDEAVLECGELLSEVGSSNYAFVVGQGLPLLSAKELEEKTRGATMDWSLDQAELVAAAAPVTPVAGRGRGRKRKRAAVDPGAAVDAAVEAVVSGAGGAGGGGGGGGGGGAERSTPQATVGTVDGSEHISLPQEVLEQVMNGKGYLVDENGERLEIRVLGDQVQAQ